MIRSPYTWIVRQGWRTFVIRISASEPTRKICPGRMSPYDESGRGEVLAEGAGKERKPLRLQFLDQFDGEQADRLAGEAVVLPVVPIVPLHPLETDAGGRDGLLRERRRGKR